MVDMERLEQDIHRADKAGLAVMVHAVGDRANRELVNMFESLESHRTLANHPPPAFPHRIEHVQMIRPKDIDRLRSLNVALCVTPANMVLDMNLIDTALGERGQWTYCFRQLMDSGAPVIFSSDCPVCDPDPLKGIHAAVTRQRVDGTPQEGWWPDSRVTVVEALKAYTITPSMVHNAYEIGAIAPYKRADLVVLSENVMDIPVSQIKHVQVDMTLFDGRIVHRKF